MRVLATPVGSPARIEGRLLVSTDDRPESKPLVRTPKHVAGRTEPYGYVEPVRKASTRSDVGASRKERAYTRQKSRLQKNFYSTPLTFFANRVHGQLDFHSVQHQGLV